MKDKAIACVPWGDQSVLSSKRQCARCGRDVAVSLAAVKHLKECDAICLRCAQAEVESNPELLVGATLPEVYTELRAQGLSEQEIEARSREMRRQLLGRER